MNKLDLNIGTPVHNKNGKCGKLEKLVIDPETMKVWRVGAFYRGEYLGDCRMNLDRLKFLIKTWGVSPECFEENYRDKSRGERAA